MWRSAPWIVACVIGLAAAPAVAERVARDRNTARGSCDGLVDYASELRPAALALAGQTDLGGGLVEVELSMQLQNLDRGRFRAASVLPQIAAGNALGILTDPPPIPADFGAIAPLGSASAVATLVLRLPAAHVAELLADLADGTLPVTVHADEETVFPPGTRVRNWSSFWDVRFDEWPNPALPDEPGAIYEIFLPRDTDTRIDPTRRPTYAGDAGDGFGALDIAELCPVATGAGCFIAGSNDQLFLTPGDEPLYELPERLHYVRVLAIAFENRPPAGEGIWMQLQRTDAEALPDLVASGSFCTGAAHQIDPPVAETRVHHLDRDVVHPEDRDGHGQQIRFNHLPWWADGRLAVSGQIGCHALKPRIALRLRDGHVTSEAGFDADCSLTAEMRAYDDVEVEEYEDPIEMWRTCFPLPSLPLGAASVPMTLQLKHLIDVSARASAGAVVGFTKHWRSGFTVACRVGPGVPQTCTSTSHDEPTPIDFTPPQLTDQTNVSLEAKTTLEAALRLGVEYPLCELGAGVTLSSSAWAALTVHPTLDPWWRTTFGMDVVGGADLGIYGLGLVSVETDIFVHAVDGPDAGGPLLGGVLGGLGRPAGMAAARASALPAEAPAFVSGADQRWAVAIDDVVLPNGVDTAAIAALPDGSAIALANEAVGGRGTIVKLDPFGAFDWARRYAIGKAPQRVRSLPDGTVIVAGSPAWLAQHDAAGHLVWSFDGTIARANATSAPCGVRDVVALSQAPGVYDYVAVGTMGATLPTSNDGCAFRVNADGSVPWAKVYEREDVQYFRGATGLRDGAVAVVGEAHVEVFGNRRMPLIVKLDAATGDVVWAQGLPMLRLARLNAVTEALDGTIVAVGGALRIIWQTGAALVAAIAPDGTRARHAMLFQDFQWEYDFDFETFVPTSAGETAYDEFFDVAPQGDGFVVVGRSGLGTATDAWAAKINRQLGVEWHRVFDSPSTDALRGVAVAADGLFVAGNSGGLPEPDGPTTGEHQLWAMKLPFTGAVEFAPHVDVTTRYLAPGVRFSSIDPLVTLDDDARTDVAFTAADALVASAGPNAALAAPSTSHCVALLTASGQPSTRDGCAEIVPTTTTTVPVTTTTAASTTTTTVTTTTVPAPTTSTTIPTCDEALECDDGDPCTTDACAGGVCESTPIGDAAGAACQVEAALGRSVCEGVLLDRKLSAALRRGLERAARALSAAGEASGRKRTRALARAGAALDGLGRRVAKAAAHRRRPLSLECATELTQMLAGLRAAIPPA